jgi:hypothetical protein
MSRETAIRQVHATLTPEALEALANKGLLRRAQKDLERGEVGAFAMGDTGLATTVSGHRVCLNESGPAKAACTCPAPGVCQHILAACLQLMQTPATTPASARDEWLALTDEELLAAFGLPTLRAAHELSLAYEAETDDAAIVTVRFPALNAEVLGIPGAGIGGVIVNGMSERRHAQLAAAAILLVRRAAGKDWHPPVATGGLRTVAPLNRDDALNSTATLLEEMIGVGLARLSPSVVERLDALAIWARTAELPRAALLLQRIASQAEDWLRRRPHADLGLILAEMATLYALVHAGPRFAGVGRESYIDVGALDLIGVAAWPWRTASGYEGLTLLLWDPANSAWTTWSDARPRAFQGDFNAVARFTQPGPWEGAESPAQFIRSRARLMNAKRNRWGRLSSSAQTKALITGPADLRSIAPAHDDWSVLDAQIVTTLGLRERDPRSAFQIVRPAAWERQAFDPVSQSLIWLLRDTRGHPLTLHLPYDDLTRPAIERLEKFSEDELRDNRLLGRCLRLHGRLQIEPLALIRDDQSLPLFFADAAPVAKNATAGAPPPASASTDDEIEEADPEPVVESRSAISQLTLAAISAIEWLAESGLNSRQSGARARLDDLAKQAGQLGLAKLQPLLATVPDESSLLRIRWLLAVLQRAH